MDARRARAKAEKKAKKAAAKRKVEAEDTDFKAPAPIAGTSSNNGTSKDVAKVAVNGKKAKTSSHSKTDDKSKIKSSSGAKNGVQNDPTKSEVFKSLFASHKSAQNRPKGNWVTFDPRYN